MHIEFPVVDNKITAIRNELKEWSETNEVTYTETLAKNHLRVTLPRDGDYTRFALTWPRQPTWIVPNIVHKS